MAGGEDKPSEIGRFELRAKRPSAYLDPSNPQWPEEATLPIALPPSVGPESTAHFQEEVGTELKRQEAAAQAEVQRRGHGFLGAERARQVSPYDRAASFEVLRARNPTFAVGRE